jgi:outer membrane protein TolC
MSEHPRQLLAEDAEQIERLRARLDEAERVLRELLDWQPGTRVGRAALHPQHLAAVERAEDYFKEVEGRG